jgi:hypothetical protein
VKSNESKLDECPNCDDKYATMLRHHTPEHDKKIMEQPPSEFKCPDCGESAFAFALETGKDWKCRRRSGGCGFLGWVEEDSSIQAPDELEPEKAESRNAWSRYQRYKLGTFEYRD